MRKKERFWMRGFRSALCAVFLLAGLSLSQSFYRSQGLELFNRGNFEAAIPAMAQWAQEHEAEKGVAYYYVGESHYNLGLVAGRDSEQKEHLVQASQNLAAALQQPDLGDPSNDLTEAARYKLAWCYFRLSELNDRPLGNLQAAASRFGELRSAADTLSVLAGYMAGESQLRTAQHLRLAFCLSPNAGEAVGLAESHQLALREAESAFRQAAESQMSPKRLALSARIRLQDLADERGALARSMPADVWAALDGRHKAGAFQESRKYFESANYGNTLSAFPGPLAREFRPLVIYSETQKNLSLYLLTGEDQYVRSFNGLLDSLRWTAFQAEKLLFQGNRDQRQSSRSEDYQRLAMPSRSHYAKAAATIPEALYWLAWVQFVANVEGSDSFFQQFLEQTRQSAADDRIDYLREDARYRILLIQFDRYAADRSRLRSLKDEIQSFNPRHSDIVHRKELLLQLIRIGLDEPIWGQVLQAANTDARLDEAFILIRNMLVRASIVTGKERLQYLSYLDRLFQITQERRSVETTFYKGMALFLRAEIQENASQKRQLFHSAAELLRNIQDPYRLEGEYIRARSYFSSAKHELKESERYNVFDRSEPLFIGLINQAGSVRALYYLGEIFRIRGNDLAARRCYERVMLATRNQAGGEFWFNNAQAGWATCRAAGDTSVLRGIEIGRVVFPERLLTVQGEEISLEKFADTDFIRNQYWEESLALLMKFGLPRRDLYPSIHVPAFSRFTRRSFDPVSAGLNERIGAVYSGLRLTILYPEDVAQESMVRLNSIPLEKDSRGEFRKSPISLGEVIEVRVEHPLCYPFAKTQTFFQPGIQELIAPLVEKQNYVPSAKPMEGVQVPFSGQDRWEPDCSHIRSGGFDGIRPVPGFCEGCGVPGFRLLGIGRRICGRSCKKGRPSDLPESCGIRSRGSPFDVRKKSGTSGKRRRHRRRPFRKFLCRGLEEAPRPGRPAGRDRRPRMGKLREEYCRGYRQAGQAVLPDADCARRGPHRGSPVGEIVFPAPGRLHPGQGGHPPGQLGRRLLGHAQTGSEGQGSCMLHRRQRVRFRIPSLSGRSSNRSGGWSGDSL